MAKLVNKVNGILKKHFPTAILEIESSTDSKKLGGFITWSGFKGKDHVKRQELIWNALTKSLTREEQLKITAIFTLTPDEAFVDVEE
jgi:acid stress-induced BolA-like protein IbaG/YrbA